MRTFEHGYDVVCFIAKVTIKGGLFDLYARLFALHDQIITQNLG